MTLSTAATFSFSLWILGRCAFSRLFCSYVVSGSDTDIQCCPANALLPFQTECGWHSGDLPEERRFCCDGGTQGSLAGIGPSPGRGSFWMTVLLLLLSCYLCCIVLACSSEACDTNWLQWCETKSKSFRDRSPKYSWHVMYNTQPCSIWRMTSIGGKNSLWLHFYFLSLSVWNIWLPNWTTSHERRHYQSAQNVLYLLWYTHPFGTLVQFDSLNEFMLIVIEASSTSLESQCFSCWSFLFSFTLKLILLCRFWFCSFCLFINVPSLW